MRHIYLIEVMQHYMPISHRPCRRRYIGPLPSCFSLSLSLLRRVSYSPLSPLSLATQLKRIALGRWQRRCNVKRDGRGEVKWGSPRYKSDQAFAKIQSCMNSESFQSFQNSCNQQSEEQLFDLQSHHFYNIYGSWIVGTEGNRLLFFIVGKINFTSLNISASLAVCCVSLYSYPL